MQSISSIRLLPLSNFLSQLKPVFQWRQSVVVAIVMFMTSGSWIAANGQQAQSTPVTKCGVVLSAPGLYTLTQPLKSGTPTQDCLQVSSPGVILLLHDYTITGVSSKVGTAAGIRILSTASGVRIQGTSNSRIQNFGVGVVVQGSGVSLIDLNVTDNVAQGILLSNTRDALLYSINSIGNGAAGLELAQSTGIFVSGELGALQQNGTYGLWVHSSSNNQFLDVNAIQNNQGGIYVGEPSNGKESQPDSSLSAAAPSQHNAFLSGDSALNIGDGVRIGAGDTLNVVVSMTGFENTGTDAVDENGNCSSNTWSNNTLSTKNPSCIE